MRRLNQLSGPKSTTSAGKQFHGATIRSAKKCLFPQTMTALDYSLYRCPLVTVTELTVKKSE